MNWKAWIIGLVSAIISGGANAITVAIIAPETFNLDTGLSKLAMAVIAGAIIGVSNYLKTKPLPPEVMAS
ncbi:MAG: hypothetical protein WCY36_08105 [Candidatus Omnitrophota bacterium]|jgi:ABC-type branched-subunit amino acid transport system permease subunit